MICSVVSNPIWMVNTRIALSQGESKSILGTVKEIYVKEGISAFFKGIVPNLVLVVNPIINFVVYEQLK